MGFLSINKNSSNSIVDYLYSVTTISSVKYLYEFINQNTKAKSYCIPVELSTELQAYNKFTMVDTTSPNPLTGQINLEPGTYEYNVYQQTSTTNLNPSAVGTTKIKSEGMARVFDTTSHTNTSHSFGTITNTEHVD
jgi:hypothetical protein